MPAIQLGAVSVGFVTILRPYALPSTGRGQIHVHRLERLGICAAGDVGDKRAGWCGVLAPAPASHRALATANRPAAPIAADST
jgi:hypothetical protein